MALRGGDSGVRPPGVAGRKIIDGVAERRAVKDVDIITVRYTDGGHAPANATTQEPEKCTCRDSWARADDGAGVRRLAAEFNGWRSRRQQWL